MTMTKSGMKRILIVEDDQDMHEIYRMIFSGSEGRYKIDIERRAEAALEKTKEQDYDLIILDIIMEPMTGDSFFVYVRDNKKTAETPIIVVSVLSSDTLQALKKINHVQFLQKPIAEAQLLAKIEQMIGKGEGP